MHEPGTYDIIVVYEDQKLGKKLYYKYKIVVLSDEVSELNVQFKKNEIIWGTAIDKNDLIVKAIFSDGRIEEVSDYKMIYDSMPNDYGPIVVNISYKNYMSSFVINVVGMEIDEEYIELVNEGEKILTRMGVDNPSSPKNYKLVMNSDDKYIIKISGILGIKMETFEQLYQYLIENVLYDYEYIKGPEIYNDTFPPSQLIVFKNSLNDLTISFYFVGIMGMFEYIADIE